MANPWTWLTTAPRMVTEPVRQWGESFAAPTLADAEAPWRAAIRGGLAGMAEAASEQLTPLNAMLALAPALRGLTAARPAVQALRAVAREAPVQPAPGWPGVSPIDLGRMPANADAELQRLVSALRGSMGEQAVPRLTPRPVETMRRWPGLEPVDVGRVPADVDRELERVLSALRTIAGEGR